MSCSGVDSSTLDSFTTSCGSDANDASSTGVFVCSSPCMSSLSSILAVRKHFFLKQAVHDCLN